MASIDSISSRPLARVVITAACAACASFMTQSAKANPRSLPLTYPYATLPEGEAEVEQAIDLTPLRYVAADNTTPWEPRYKLQTEFEYGITDRLEIGLYLQAVQAPGGSLGFDGIKQRLRYRFAEAGQWPVDIGIYGEVAELRDELELEQKIIIERDIGKLQLITNLRFEQAFEHYSGEVEPSFNPTLGASYEMTPSFRLGAEYWMHAALIGAEEGTDSFNTDPHHFLGPAFSFVWGKLWWTTAAYARLDSLSRAVHPGDKYGRVWVRSLIGLSL